MTCIFHFLVAFLVLSEQRAQEGGGAWTAEMECSCSDAPCCFCDSSRRIKQNRVSFGKTLSTAYIDVDGVVLRCTLWLACSVVPQTIRVAGEEKMMEGDTLPGPARGTGKFWAFLLCIAARCIISSTLP